MERRQGKRRADAPAGETTPKTRDQIRKKSKDLEQQVYRYKKRCRAVDASARKASMGRENGHRSRSRGKLISLRPVFEAPMQSNQRKKQV